MCVRTSMRRSSLDHSSLTPFVQVSDGLSCRGLDCSGLDSAACSVCLHNSTAYLVNQQVACNCTGTNYAGTTCSIPKCQNGGTVVGDTSCSCVPPFTGDAFCSRAVCFNGGQLGHNKTCNCPIEWTGVQCDIASGISAPTNPEASSSSSSSTGAASTGGLPNSNSNSLSAGAIAGIVIGAIVGGGLLVGAVYYLTTGAKKTVVGVFQQQRALETKRSTGTDVEREGLLGRRTK